MARRTVAVLGASPDHQKFGNKSLRAHAAKGWEVYPIHPKADQVEGHKAYARLADVPVEHLDRVTVYLPPPATLSVLDEIAEKGCDELFLNPGTHDPRVEEKCRQLGLNAIYACSIVDLGLHPSQFP
jgi:hypothetical protein